MNLMTVMPSYGKIYESVEAMHTDWLAGRDFRIDGTTSYISCRDVLRNTLDIKTRYQGIQILQKKRTYLFPNRPAIHVPYLTVGVLW